MMLICLLFEIFNSMFLLKTFGHKHRINRLNVHENTATYLYRKIAFVWDNIVLLNISYTMTIKYGVFADHVHLFSSG